MPQPLQCYSGPLRVEDDEFELVAERFIPKDDGASFRFSGLDEFGGFSVDGFAKRFDNIYAAGSQLLNYAHYSGENRARIDFTLVRESDEQDECRVHGAWFENGKVWTFEGALKRFNPKRQVSVKHRASPAHVASAKEIGSIQRKLYDQAKNESARARAERKLREYAKKSAMGMRKGRSKAKRRDVFSKGKRTPGGAFSRRG